MRRPEEMTALLQIAFDALSLGSLYAICALGIALIFGVMRLVNFAQGDYIAFCVFALLWPSIDATAIVFLGNLPWFVLVPAVLMFGVRANRVIMLAFAVSGALAAAVGLIRVTQTGTADIQMGVSVMLVAFIATVIGGLGSLTGAVLAGYLIGAASVVMQVGLPLEARPFRDAFVYGAVIVSLIWRPQGLFAPSSTKQRI